jgi:hypothetical protein
MLLKVELWLEVELELDAGLSWDAGLVLEVWMVLQLWLCWRLASDQGGGLDGGVEQNNDFHAIFILASRYSKILY